MSITLSYKNQLQEYLQKASLPLPVYETINEGHPHLPKFRSTVTVNGVQYSSSSDFRTLKAAELAAAKIALEDLVKKKNGGAVVPSPVDSRLSKSLLQEYAQKMNLPLPVYTSVKSGVIHSPTFSTTMEIAGVSYSGGAASTKKEAESKAARTALFSIEAQARSLGSQLYDYPGKRSDTDLKDPGKELQQEKMEKESRDTLQVKRQGGCKEVQEKQKGEQEMDLSSAMNKIHIKEDKSMEQIRQKKSGSHRNKKA